MNRAKEPLYRKEKKTGLSRYGHIAKGAETRWSRHSKAARKDKEEEISHKSIKRGKYGYDYTPLYRFLLSKVGEPWDDVYSEAVSRLDKTEPIFHMVVLQPEPGERPSRRLGENAYFSTLTVDAGGILVKVDPSYEMTEVHCTCCTHTWNGKRIENNS
ncbi:hypothetical protein HRG84_11570 [Flavisolibacter sp. BT320]|nr:hypothetical protein [Flavisolibacter longurius]